MQTSKYETCNNNALRIETAGCACKLPHPLLIKTADNKLHGPFVVQYNVIISVSIVQISVQSVYLVLLVIVVVTPFQLGQIWKSLVKTSKAYQIERQRKTKNDNKMKLKCGNLSQICRIQFNGIQFPFYASLIITISQTHHEHCHKQLIIFIKH